MEGVGLEPDDGDYSKCQGDALEMKGDVLVQ